MELITESKQELPGWLESMASDFRMNSGRRSNGSKGYVFILLFIIEIVGCLIYLTCFEF